MRRSPNVHPNSAAARARCQGDACLKKGAGVVMRIRIDAKFQTERKRLCAGCAKAGGWTLGFGLPVLHF